MHFAMQMNAWCKRVRYIATVCSKVREKIRPWVVVQVEWFPQFFPQQQGSHWQHATPKAWKTLGDLGATIQAQLCWIYSKNPQADHDPSLNKFWIHLNTIVHVYFFRGLLKSFGLYKTFLDRYPWLDKLHLFAANTCGVSSHRISKHLPEGSWVDNCVAWKVPWMSWWHWNSAAEGYPHEVDVQKRTTVT